MNPIDRSDHTASASPSAGALSPVPSSSALTTDASIDTVESKSTNQPLSNVKQAKADIPALPPPATAVLSIADAFRSWTAAIRDFKNILKASALSNLDVRQKLNTLSLNQALDYIKVLQENENLLANLDEIVKAKNDEFDTLLSSMRELPKGMQKEINNINSGNRKEKEEFQKITEAYQNFLDKLEALGSKDLGDGHYSIPPGEEEKFNQILKEYQGSVNSFNQYWGSRFSQIEAYNAAVRSYNTQAEEANLVSDEFIRENDLSSYLQENGINSPSLDLAQERDTSGYLGRLDEVTMETDGSSAYISPLPPYISSPSEISIPDLPSNSIEQLLRADITAALHDQLYAKATDSLENSPILFSSYISLAKESAEAKNEASEEKLSIFKKGEKEYGRLIKKYLTTLNRTTESSLALEEIKIERKEIQTILGSELIKTAILKELEGSDLIKNEALADQLTQKVLLLSVTLLNNLSVQSLFPSMGLLADGMESLPKESPAYTILFSVSLANRIGENIHSRLSEETVEKFLSSIPESAKITPEGLSRIEAAINIGQLLAVSKLLEDSLGIEGLVPTLITSSSPSLDVAPLSARAADEDLKTKALLQEKLYSDFIAKGYPEDKALFLAQEAVEISTTELLYPPILNRISEQTLDLNLLNKSLRMELALIHTLPLSEGETLTNRALALTFEQGPFHSSDKFRDALSSNLADLGIPNSKEIALALPLSPLPAVPLTDSLNSESSRAAIENRVDQLLPQLNRELRDQIALEVLDTLLGSSTPFLDLSHLLKQEISRLKKGEDIELTEALLAIFIESIRTMTSFPDFALKLLDPAHQYLQATSLIYRKDDKTIRGDIQI